MALRKNILVALLTITLHACAISASARQGGVPASPPANRPETEQTQPVQDQSELMRSLNLTPEQRARVAEIRRETEQQSQQITQQLRRSRRALERAIYAENADEAIIQQRAKEVADAEAARVKMRADAELKVRRVLTPEQFATFRELRRQTQLRQQSQNASGGIAPPAGRRQGLRNLATPPPTLTPRQQRRLEERNRRPPTRP
ncbi:MAG: Spy/CpxP family protein refolding chaperone [Pyrinomonadaceae bacterium]